jgi:hypothetical protein
MRLIKLTSTGLSGLMFDAYVDTQYEVADAIVQEIDVSGRNAIAVLNNYGISCNVTIVDNDTSEEFFNKTVSLIRDSIKDWWDYFFAPCRTGRDIVFYFPERSNATATMTISHGGDTAKCGMCIPGNAYDVGTTRYGAKVGISDYSIVETNDFGVTYLNEGAWAKRCDADVFHPLSDTNYIFSKYATVRGSACVFDFNEYQDDIGTSHTSADGYQCLIVYGFYSSYDPSITGPSLAEYSLEVQGMI